MLAGGNNKRDKAKFGQLKTPVKAVLTLLWLELLKAEEH